jgi:hypothetical protein
MQSCSLSLSLSTKTEEENIRKIGGSALYHLQRPHRSSGRVLTDVFDPLGMARENCVRAVVFSLPLRVRWSVTTNTVIISYACMNL